MVTSIVSTNSLKPSPPGGCVGFCASNFHLMNLDLAKIYAWFLKLTSNSILVFEIYKMSLK